MDSDGSASSEVPVDVIFENELEEESLDTPSAEWSVIDIGTTKCNPKMILYADGLYDPGSGNICTKYIPQSTSTVIRHPYYQYPAITDPGILDVLLKPKPPIIYPEDGQARYLAVCEEMKQYPVRTFYRGLLEEEINLQYYSVNSSGVRAMAIALENNLSVKTFNLTDNFLNTDACYHLGVMLSHNRTIEELILSGCRMGATAFQMFLTKMVANRTLNKLNVRGNELGDTGMQHLAEAIANSFSIKAIDLSRNNISGKGVDFLAEAFEAHYNRFTHWNLSWNNLYSPGTYNFLCKLVESTDQLVEMDLSWNGLTGVRIAQGISNLLRVPTLQYLNLSNNRLEGQAVQIILSNLAKAKKLVTLNLSYNPMTPKDALFVLGKLLLRAARVRNVYMENVNVEPMFISLLDSIVEQKPYLKVTYGYVLSNYKVKGPDLRELVLNRAAYLCSKVKKSDVSIALIALQLQKENITIMSENDFFAEAKRRFGVPLDEDLVNGIAQAFPGDHKGKKLTINIDSLVDYVKRKWPDSHLPPTPPPISVTETKAPEPLDAKKKKKKK